MKMIEEELIDRILLGVIMILSISILFVVISKNDECEVISDTNEVKSIVKEEKVEEQLVDSKICVDIKGAVKKAGVYELDYGARVNEKTTTNMIQKTIPIFEVNPLISKEI